MLNYLDAELDTFSSKFIELKNILSETEAQDGSQIDLELNIKDIDIPFAVSDLIARIEAVQSLLEGLAKSETSALVPLILVKETRDSIKDCRTQIEALIQNFANTKTAGGIASIKGDNCEIHGSNGIQFSLIPLLSGLFISSDNMLRHTLELHKLTSSEGFSDFTNVWESWSSAYKKIKKEREEISDIIGDVKNKEREVLDAHKAVTDSYKLISSIQSEAQSDNQKKQKDINEINAKIEQIREITKDADTLKANIAKSQAELESFDKTLEARNKNYDAAKLNLDKAIEQIEASGYLIDERIEQSEKMLTGATVAGLASKFGDLHTKLEKQLSKAAWGFYISIIFLAFTCLPILDYFFPVVTKLLDLNGEIPKSAGSENPVQDLIVRAILLLPASWLTIFSAKKYANLFKLKEHYAYKYSIASSVEGFKRQAPEYEDAIAYSAFHELSFNPAEGIDGKKMVADHPIRDFALNILDGIKTNLLTNKPNNKEGK